MKRHIFIPLAALVFAAACSESANTPTGVPDGPSFSKSNVHFNYATAEVSPNPDLLVSFKITGLGNGQTIDIFVGATANLFQDCVNGGGKQPAAANKHFDAIPVLDQFTATANAGGNIETTHTLEFPSPTLSCPPGQQLVTEGFWDDAFVRTGEVPSSGKTLSADIPGTFDVSL
jgi:hypothetical protein